ncbi:MAG: hypothetical protein P8J37_01070 [Fuerstiella sp.]|nr:hypothetical protein [Fuerstiella sp.]
MLFNSWQFAIFFPVVATLYFLMPYRFRWALLLIASYTFYMVAIPAYGLLLLGSTVVDYFLGIAIASSSRQARRRLMLALSLSANLGVLFLFKYFNLFADSVGGLAEFMGGSLSLPVSQLILPIGISFYTFQTLSYSIDVFRGDLQPERHFGRYALYVSFFPQLVAGPIERATHFLPQLTRENSFDYDRVCSGLRLMGWGLFKKIVIADHLAVFVQAVYQQPESLTGPHYVLATVFLRFRSTVIFPGTQMWQSGPPEYSGTI